MHAGLQILKHPQGNSAINLGQCVTLNVSAVGSGQLSYCWKKDGRTVTDPKCSGTDGPTLKINTFSTDDQGEYLCVIENSHNTIKSNSANMVLGKYQCQILSKA